MTTESFLQLIIALEYELQDPIIRRSADRLNELIHTEFKEFGSSGRTFTKQDMLSIFPTANGDARIRAENFVLQQLSSELVLLTYKSERLSENGNPVHQALRSSIWKLESDGWQIIFHQGTPINNG